MNIVVLDSLLSTSIRLTSDSDLDSYDSDDWNENLSDLDCDHDHDHDNDEEYYYLSDSKGFSLTSSKSIILFNE
jgi:hypothetical protein